MYQTTCVSKFSFLHWIKRCKEPHVLRVLVWMFLTGVLVPDHDGEGCILSQKTYILKFSFLHWIKRCKELQCPWSPGWGLWRILTGVLVPDHDWDTLPLTSQFCKYLNIPKRTPNGRVINYWPLTEIVTSEQTDIHCFFVYVDGRKLT